jgi:hypothetical protein
MFRYITNAMNLEMSKRFIIWDRGKYVASVLSGCCICYTGYTHMLQMYVSNVSAISNVCCKFFLSRCLNCSARTHMLQMYIINVSFILDICCSKCFMLQVFHEQTQQGAQAKVVRHSGPRVRA